MKLSDIKGERTFDVIADIIDPIANIAEDKEASELFHKKAAPDGMNPKAFLMQRIKKSVPKLLRGHKKDVISILSTIAGVNEHEYCENLNLVKLTKDCIDLLNDDAFMTLFISAQSGESSSGSAPESIKDIDQ